MNTQHTPGPLKVAVEIFDNDGQPETAIQALNGAATVAVALEFGPNNPHMRAGNARRLVACWNACEGIADPENVIPRLLAANEKIPALEAMRAQHDDLLEALQTMLKHPGTITAQLVAQAAIAKATGAPAAQRLPADDTEGGAA